MPYDGTGVYSPPLSPTFPAVGGTIIQADHYNQTILDIAAALTNALKRDGQGTWTGDQKAGGRKLTGLGNATQPQDAVTLSQMEVAISAGVGTLSANTMVAPASGEARIGVTYTGTESVYLFSNPSAYGLYSPTGGVLIDYERSTGKKRLGGTIDISTLVKNDGGTYGISISGNAATATLAATATTALTATNATNATNATLAAEATKLAGAVGAAPSIACRAWVLFDATTMTVLGQSNVASVVKLAAGDYRITFTTPMPSAVYAVNVTGYREAPGGNVVYGGLRSELPTAATVRVGVGQEGSPTGVDRERVSVTVFC